MKTSGDPRPDQLRELLRFSLGGLRVEFDPRVPAMVPSFKPGERAAPNRDHRGEFIKANLPKARATTRPSGSRKRGG